MSSTKVLVFYRCKNELKNIIARYCSTSEQGPAGKNSLWWSWYSIDKSSDPYITEDIHGFITADGFLIDLDSLFWRMGDTSASYFQNLLSVYTQYAQNAHFDSVIIYFHN